MKIKIILTLISILFIVSFCRAQTPTGNNKLWVDSMWVDSSGTFITLDNYITYRVEQVTSIDAESQILVGDGITNEVLMVPSGESEYVRWGFIDSTNITNGTVDADDLWSSDFALDGAGLTTVTGITFGATSTGLNVNVDGTSLQIVDDTLEVIGTGTGNIEPETQVITDEAGQTYEVLMHVGEPTVRYSFIDSMSLNDNCIRTAELANDAVTSAIILDSTITGNNIGLEQISGYHLIDGFEGDGLSMEDIDAASQIMHVNTDDETIQITSDTLELNSVYGFLYHSVADTDTVTIVTAGTYYDIDGYDGSDNDHTTVSTGNGTMTVPYTGVYSINANYSFFGKDDAIYTLLLYVDENPS